MWLLQNIDSDNFFFNILKGNYSLRKINLSALHDFPLFYFLEVAVASVFRVFPRGSSGSFQLLTV